MTRDLADDFNPEWHADLITDHPFTPATFRDAWPGICGYMVDGWPCAATRAEHADRGEP
jgi:hypothetical protein